MVKVGGTGLVLVGTLAGLVGIAWTLQGADLVGGSRMSGHSEWLWIGIGTAVTGLICVAAGYLLRGR